MRLEIASRRAVVYASKVFHYAKRPPADCLSFSVFEDNQWCGVVSFGRGNINIHMPFGLKRGEALELLRVALNGKQSTTSKAVSIACKLVKAKAPNVKLLISYADQEQGHKGTIYQSMNWYYTGENKSNPKWICPKTGKDIHDRDVTPSGYAKTFGVFKKVHKISDLIRVDVLPKHKYIYPLDKSLIPMCKAMSKPYPKHAPVAEGNAPANQAGDGGRPDPGAQIDSHEKQQNPTT
jgi:hypothetical protein